MKYSINLIRLQRQREEREERWRVRISLFTMFSIAVLAAAAIFTVFQVLVMHMAVTMERENCARIKNEYGKYKATKMILDKADIELLDSLQSNRIFWTRTLTAMAFYLPENYWITQFSYQPQTFRATGFGYISLHQDQLISIDNYLNLLRADSTYRNVFPKTIFNSTTRADENKRGRVSFEFSSIR